MSNVLEFKAAQESLDRGREIVAEYYEGYVGDTENMMRDLFADLFLHTIVRHTNGDLHTAADDTEGLATLIRGARMHAIAESQTLGFDPLDVDPQPMQTPALTYTVMFSDQEGDLCWMTSTGKTVAEIKETFEADALAVLAEYSDKDNEVYLREIMQGEVKFERV